MILTPQRLQLLANTQHLKDVWYLIATVTLTVCNQPQEIPKLYHYALHMKHLNERPSQELYDKVSKIIKKYEDIKATGTDFGYSPYNEDITNMKPLFQTTEKFRESILKTSALSGLPKAINSMMILKDNTPSNLLRSKDQPNRSPIRKFEDYKEIQERGINYWNKVYTKISGRVINQMSSSYPDLWVYALQDVYSPLLSYCDVLSSKETSLIVIASLVPQDVNPQLKGHLKGAVNNGVAVEAVRETRDIAMQIGGWCGVAWEGTVASV